MADNRNVKNYISDICDSIQSEIRMDESMIKTAVIHDRDADYMFMDIHHLAVDGVSWRVISSDLELAYSQLLRGEEIRLPEKTNTYSDYAEASERYRDSYHLEQEIPYWESVQEKLEQLPFSDELNADRQFEQLELTLPEEAGKSFLRANFNILHCDINDALLTAVCRSYKNVFQENSMSVQLEGHGREDFGEPLVIDRTVGWFTSIYPVVFENLSDDLHEDLLQVKETMHRIPNKGAGYNVLRFLDGKQKVNFANGHIPRIGFNYLGEMGQAEAGDNLFDLSGEISGGKQISEKNVFGADLSVNCIVINGIFSLNLGYNVEVCTQETAEAFANGILQEMQAISAHLSVCQEETTATDLGENEWSIEEFRAVQADYAARGETISRIYPLTPMQEAMLLKHIAEPDSWAYRLVTIFEVDAQPTEQQLQRALMRLAKKHEVLRTAIIHDGVACPRQAIIERELGVKMLDYSQLSDPESAIKAYREDVLTNDYDLQRKPLLQVTCAKKNDTTSYLVVATHHVIIDGWCNGIYTRDLFQFIGEELSGKFTVDAEAENGIYESAVREILSKNKKEALDYWRELLEGYDTRAEIPSSGEVPVEEQCESDEYYGHIDADLTEKLLEICKQEQATINNGVELLWGLLLQTYSHTEDAVFAKVVSGRDNTTVDVTDLVGLFINSVPVRVKISKDVTGREMIRALQKQAAESNTYDFCALSEIQQQSELGSQLFQNVLAFENFNSGNQDAVDFNHITLDPKIVLMKEETFDEITPAFYVDEENQLSYRITFNKKHYRVRDIEKLMELFRVLMTGIVNHPDQAISTLSRVSEEEYKDILKLSAGEELSFDRSETWVDLFKSQAHKHSDSLAVIDSVSSLTYGELEKQSDAVAAYLVRSGVKPNDFVVIQMGRVKEFVVAVLGINKAGAAYVPIDPDYPADRIQYMIEDSEAKVVMTEEVAKEAILTETDSFVNMASPDKLAYMIYTSGSTGKPKGAMIYHKGFRSFVAWNNKTFGHGFGTNHLVHASFSFDASVFDMLCPLAAGATIHIAGDDLRHDLTLMADYIEKHQITGMLVNTQVGAALVNSFDTSLKYLALGGEKMLPVRKSNVKLYNAYGPTEFTAAASYYPVQGDEKEIPIGRPVPNTYSFICDKAGNLMPQGIAGELCLAGEQIGAGYWKLPDKTDEVFVDCPFLPGEKMYRTGDLVRYNTDGNLEYIGRIDFQVKLRGFRIELGEIENRAAAYDTVNLVIALVKQEKLVLYYTSDQKIDQQQLKQHMGETLADYMVPDVFMQLDEMPMTPGGKIDRRALPEPELNVADIVKPSTELEDKLLRVVKEQLKVERFGVTSNFISFGMSSIAAMKLSANIRKELGWELKVADILKNATVRELAEMMMTDQEEDHEVIVHVSEREYYPITENQRGIYIDWEMNRDTTQYNIPAVYKFSDKEAERLAEAVRKAIDAHSSLKTGFVLVNEDIMQQPHENEAAEVFCQELEAEPDREFFQSRIRPFDLFRDSLYRAEIYSWDRYTYLLLDVHHTFYDGMSNNVFMRDVLAAYDGHELKQEEITAFDFAVYENDLQDSEKYEKAEAYFARLVSEASVARYRDSAKADGIKSGIIETGIDRKIIDTICSKNEVTVSSFLNAAFAETLSRVTREENPMYLTICNGREADTRLSECVGMFVKTLPVVLQTENHGKESVAEYVKRFHEQLMDTIANDFYPYTRIVEKYGLKGEIMFVYQGGIVEGGVIQGVETISLDLDTTKMPVSVTAYPTDDSYMFRITYNGNRYSAADMEIFARAIANTALGMAKTEKVSEVEMVSQDEKAEILKASYGGTVTYDTGKTWLSMFAEQVKNQPDRLAVADKNSAYTYAELDHASNKIANELIHRGVAVNDFVAIKIGRVKEYVAAFIGIQKAGAAFVPVDLTYPADRVAYMLEDADVQITLTEEEIKAVINSDSSADSVDRSNVANRAYMIYTSGSTGRPKGVVLHQRGLMNFTLGIMSMFELTKEDRISSHRSFSFDAHIGDFYPTLCAGASVHIMPEDIRKDLDMIYSFLNEHRITGGGYTTSIAKLLLTNYDLKQRYISCGGEALRDVSSSSVQIFNLYGPTECTNDIVIGKLEKGRYYEAAPIGRPMINSYCFIVDKYNHLVPQGMAGEICYAGPQTGYGYWKLEEKTKEVFEECPFAEGLRMYHTGDVGFYDEEGFIEYIGRIDFQVKLNGFRIELGEIEEKALQYEQIQMVSAQVRKSQICLYYTANGDVDEEKLTEFLAVSLAEYMIPKIYIKMDSMPLTPNGKIDRRALPDIVLSSNKEYVQPVTREEIILAECMQKILGREDAVGALDNFFELGGDSIKAIRMVSMLRQQEVTLLVADIMKLKTVRKIAAAAKGSKAVIRQDPFDGVVRNSAIIEYFHDRQMPVPNHFNQSMLMKLRERADIEKLQAAVDALTYQHDMLRAIDQGERIYVRTAGFRVMIDVYDMQTAGERELTNLCDGIQAGMKLDEKLASFNLIHASEGDYLFICIHHLAVDGVSWRILLSDLETAYGQLSEGRSPELPQKTHTYHDYVEAVIRFRSSYKLEQEISYWEKVQQKLLSLPTSKERDYDRCMQELVLHMEEQETKRFTTANFGAINADINDALLAAVTRSYRKIFGENSVSVQFEGHGREDIGSDLITDRTVGWFTSVYPVVIEDMNGDLHDDLINVKETMHRVPNKGVGYNILRYIEGDVKTDFRNEKIARIGFNYLGEMGNEQADEKAHFVLSRDFSVGREVSEHNTYGTDLSLNCVVSDGQFVLMLKYNNELLDEEKAGQFAEGILQEMQEITSYLAECTDTEPTATDLGETEWSTEEFNRIAAEYASRNEKIRRIYPLTPMQEGMLLKHVSEPESWAYRLVRVFEIDCLPTEEELNRALARIYRKHEVLRTAFIHEGVSQPRQAIIDRTLTVTMLDYSKMEDPKAAALAYRREMLTHGYDLQRKSLFQLACLKKTENSCYLVASTHHAISDGWCSGIYNGDLLRMIDEEMTGNYTADETPEDGLYEMAVREILQKDKKTGLKYWRELLEGYETKAEIPSQGEIPEEKQCETDEFFSYIDVETTEKLMNLCKEEEATISNGLELAWGLLLQTYSRTEDAVFAKVVSGRDNTTLDVNHLVGLFINSVPVRVKTEKGDTVRQMIQKLQKQAAESNAYDFCPLSEIQQQTELGSQLFQNVFAFENYNSGSDQAEDGGVSQLSYHIQVLEAREETFDEVTPAAYIVADGRLCLHLTFNKKHYSFNDMEKVAQLFNVLVTAIANSPDAAVSDLPRVSEEERQKLIALGTGRTMLRDQSETILSIFRDRVAATPDAVAIVFKERSYTYSEIDKITDDLAVYLQKQYHIEREENVGVLINRSELMLIYPLAVMKNGAAYMPLDPHFPTDRLAFMCEDANVTLILSEGELLEEKLPDYTGNSFNSSELEMLPLAVEEDIKNLTVPEAHNRLVIIFTSGSTGKPKAVELEHYGIANYCHWYAEEFELTPKDHVAGYANFGFDAHMIDLYPSILAGSVIYIFDDELRMDVVAMNEYMEANSISVAFMTTQVGCIIKDLNHSLRYLSTGGEKMPPVTPPDFRFLNVYGPTECSLFATYYDVKEYFEGEYIGYPLANYQLYVIDQNCQLVPEGVAGELLIAGEGVARGYMNREELTKEKFILFKPTEDSEPVRAYRSGDLVRWSEKDGIQFLGRIDKQVKLRGLRIELGEIENRVASYEGIKQIAVEVKNDRLCCYYVAQEKIEEEKLKTYLAETLTEFMIPEVYIRLDEMPLNANGKIDRKALPEPQVKAEEIVVPATELEQKLFDIVKDYLKVEDFGVTSNFISLGMSSITAMKLSASINQTLGLNLKVSEIMKNPTVRAIAGRFPEVEEAAEETQAELLKNVNTAAALLRRYLRSHEAVDEEIKQAYELLAVYCDTEDEKLYHHAAREYYPITENQRGIYIDWEMNRDTTQYNIPAIYKFTDKDAGELEAAVRKAINAHRVLNTRFIMVNDDIMQRCIEMDAEVSVHRLEEEPSADFFQSRVRPFDLFEDTLYRVEIYSFEEAVYLFMDIHHILYDGMSTAVLMKDILNAYAGEAVSEEEITAYDFAIYENELVNSEEYAHAEAYYENLVGKSSAITYQDSAQPDGIQTDSVIAEFDGRDIDAACMKYGITVSSYLHAAFAETLQRITREENPMYLTISNGREADTRLSGCVGMFVKTLPVVRLTAQCGRETVEEYVKGFHDQLQNTIENDFYPYTALVEKYGLKSGVMFAYQGGIMEDATVEGAELIPLTLDTVKLPVLITAYPNHGKYAISLEYDGMRYGRKEMQLLADTIGNVAVNMAKANEVREIRLVTDREASALIELGRGPVLERDQSETILTIFKNRVSETPDATALVFKNRSYTYLEIDQITDRLAVYLKKNYHIGREENVGVLINRSELMLIYPLAVMKNGAAYMPLDPHFPTDRLTFMCEDASVKLILTEEDLLEEKLPEFEGYSFNAGELDQIAQVSAEEIRELTFPEAHNRLVIIFTSGSTGKPKAVDLEHYGIVNYCHWYVSEFELTQKDHVAGYANFGFDAHMIDLYPSILAGSAIYIFDEALRMDVPAMNDYMEEQDITVGFMTTQIGCIIKDLNHSLRYLSTGGEKMPPVTPPDFRFVNGYGPTECSLFATCYDVKEYFEGEYIGYPLANYQLYVIDQNCQLVPRGVAGELLIAGEGVARGYMNRPELTAEKFIQFKPSEGSRPVKAYRSGDLVRWSEKDGIEFLGRIDKQVKLRGLRIELGEIENRAGSFDGIKQVAVEVKNDRLCCYYVSAEELDTDKLKQYLAEKLTEFMIPEIYIRLDVMPLNANGKIDRKALPEPEMTRSASYVAPETWAEKTLAESMQKILGVESEIGALDSFFELGGDSIKAIRMVSLLRQQGMELKVADIMKQKTIRKIAAVAKLAQGMSDISQEPFEGAVKDSAIVKYFKYLNLPVENHFNQSMMLKFKEPVNMELFRQAFDFVARQHDLMRAVVKDGSLYVDSPDKTVQIEEFDHKRNNEI